MPVDLAFELSYLLSDALGAEVEVKEYSYDPATGRLCVRALIGGAERTGCTMVRQCKGLEGPRLERCLSKAFTTVQKHVEELASALRG